MSGDSWLPLLGVLLLGLVSGLVVAWRLRKASAGADSDLADGALRLADLERRRESLYSKLRSIEGDADRERLEISAARVLREIDQLRQESPALGTGGGPEAPKPAVARESAGHAGRSAVGHPMLVGFLAGGSMVALVGVLIYWALSDARPREDAAVPGASTVSGEEHPVAPLPPEQQRQIDALRARLAADPSDLAAHKQLALALVSTEQYFEAFRLAQQILVKLPDDPDGLYISGMVRMAMGQEEMAMEHLDRVVEQYPNHVLALAGRGMVFMRLGDRQAAILVFERALAAAGGRHPDLEQLLEIARSGDIGAQPMEPATPAPRQAVAADSYGVRVELASGVSVPPSATLFVFLRGEVGGPPAAVKRLENPVFPLQVILGPEDSMLGRPLPTAGTLSVRLDADGSASTRGDSDLVVETEMQAGSEITVVLGR